MRLSGKKIIFLDIDGVLNSQDFYASDRYDRTKSRLEYESMLDPHAIKRLNEIIERTGAYLVLSSTWRLRFRSKYARTDIQEFFSKAGIKGTFLGRTTTKWDRFRGNQIQQWLDDQRGEPESFIILDDDSDMVHLSQHLVHCKNQHGLTDEVVEKAITRLGEK